MQITVTKSAFAQTLGKNITTFEQPYLRKPCRRERRRLLEWEEIPVQSGLQKLQPQALFKRISGFKHDII